MSEQFPQHILLIDIDGLRADVFQKALATEQIPHIARLLGGANMHYGLAIPIVASAPSITFCAQACLFTGAHPNEHGVPGNQFFDRFGTTNDGVPRHYAFDVGDTLAVDDAVRVFTDGLAAARLQTGTIYEQMTTAGRRSVVAGNMYAKGADTWLKPSLSKLARFTKGGNLFGMEAAEYDRHLLQDLLSHLGNNGVPDLLTMYFMGLDHQSHKHGPQAQETYLIEHIDPMVGELWQTVRSLATDSKPSIFVAIFSDHGQIGVLKDDEHALKLGFPFDREMGYFFDALGLDVHDFPGEDPNCDAVMALNGGLAFVYLQNRAGRWADAPRFERDVVPVGRAFWQAHHTGQYAADLQGTLAGVLIRNVEQDGWQASYRALTPDGEMTSLDDWFARQPADQYVDPVNRLHRWTGPFSGDLLLISNYADGYYFGPEHHGVHGGLHPDDSLATLAYGWPDASAAQWEHAKREIQAAIERRCRAEGGRQPSIVDMVTGLTAVIK